MRSTDLHSRQIGVEYGVTVPQLICLQVVVEHDGLSAGELARRVELSQSTCVGILDRMEAKGLLLRERSSRDRRVVLVKATEAGRVLHARAPSLLQDVLTERLAALPEGEQEQIAAALERLVEIMQIRHVDASPVLETGVDLHAEPAGLRVPARKVGEECSA